VKEQEKKDYEDEREERVIGEGIWEKIIVMKIRNKEDVSNNKEWLRGGGQRAGTLANTP
jgi:hypothetical protein